MMLGKYLWYGMFGVLVAMYLNADADLSLMFFADVVGLEENAFEAQKVWVVGASTGIGAAIAEEFAMRGASVTLSSRNVPKMEAVAKKCAAVGDEAKIVALDVLDPQARSQRLQKDADILILNAGRAQRDLAVNTSLATTREILELNFFAMIDIAKEWAVARGEKGGHIVVTSSISGKIGTPIGSSYSASKFALHGYFDAVRVELLKQNVKITLACPGPVVSDIGQHIHGVKSIEPDESKMPTQRCAYLMTVATFFQLGEVWITHQPFLLFTAILQYAPSLGKILARTIGYKRVDAFLKGKDIFDASSYLGFARK